MPEAQQDLDLSQSSLAVCLVLKRTDFLYSNSNFVDVIISRTHQPLLHRRGGLRHGVFLVGSLEELSVELLTLMRDLLCQGRRSLNSPHHA